MANIVKKNVSKGVSVFLVTFAVGIAVFIVNAKVCPLPSEVLVLATSLIAGALYAGVDALKHQ